MNRTTAAVLLGAALIFAWNVWGYDLWAPDEPYFAEGAREMVVDGHWLVPHVNGVVTTDKPPLFFWLIAVFSWPFGAVQPWTARLPSILAGLASVLLTMRLARRWYGAESAAIAGAVLAVTYTFWDKSRTAQIDALLCLLILVALSAFEAHRAGDADGRKAGLLFWFACAAAVLAKGPVGLLLPLGIAVVTLAADRRLRLWGSFAPLLGPALFLLTLALWAVPASLVDPAQYTVAKALQEHFVDRAIHGMHHEQPFWYYAKVLPVHLMPWSLIVPAAVVVAWRRHDAVGRMALVWALFVVVFFSISTEKRDLYVLPAFPAFALMVAGLTAPAVDRGRFVVRWIRWPLAIHAVLMLLIALALFVAVDRAPMVAPARVRVLGAAMLVLGLATLAGGLRATVGRALLGTAAGMGLVYLTAVIAIMPTLDPVKSARSFSSRIVAETAAERAAGRPLLTYGLGNLPEAFAFYTDGVYTVEVDELEQVRSHLSGREAEVALIDGESYQVLAASLELTELARTELSRREVVLVRGRGR